MSIRTRATAAINATVNAGIKAFWSDYGFSGSNTSGGGVYGSGSHRVPDQVRRYRNTDAAESPASSPPRWNSRAAKCATSASLPSGCAVASGRPSTTPSTTS